MTKIQLELNNLAAWHNLVHEVISSKKIILPEELESYLISVLMRFTDATDLGSKIIAEDYLASHHETTGSNTWNLKLREVGDTCLVFSGLFPEITKKRLVDLSYYIGIGRTAYQEISLHANYDSLKALYRALAVDFFKLLEVLHNLRQNNYVYTKLEAIDIFNKWNEASVLHAANLDPNTILKMPKKLQ